MGDFSFDRLKMLLVEKESIKLTITGYNNIVRGIAMYRKWLVFLFAIIVLGIPNAMTQEELLQQDGIVTLYNTHANELLTVKYLRDDGVFDKLAMEQISYHLRCPYTQKVQEIDPELIRMVDQIQDFFGKEKTVSIISGYRSPFYNGQLRSRSEGVAKYSYHMKGQAVDIAIEGIDLQDIKTYAKLLHQGGVGYYSGQFVHVDVGPVRFW